MRSYEEKFRLFLREKNLKYTTERKEIIQSLVLLKDHFDAEEIYQRLKERKSNVSLATIYRTIPLLIDSGLISETLHYRDRIVYEKIYKRKHHDHLICIHCGKIMEFYNDEVEKLQDEICRRYHFLPTEHHLRINGVCQKCQVEQKKKNQFFEPEKK